MDSVAAIIIPVPLALAVAIWEPPDPVSSNSENSVAQWVRRPRGAP